MEQIKKCIKLFKMLSFNIYKMYLANQEYNIFFIIYWWQEILDTDFGSNIFDWIAILEEMFNYFLKQP